MPDRLPPSWGHEPEDGRDLDALLSGQAPLSVEEILTDEALLAGQLAGVSDSQRPVAGAMFALRSAPAESELAGEAAARAAFRALIGTGPQHTLVLPVQVPAQGSRPPARHRHRRRAGGRGGWQVMALVGSAAALVAVGAAAVTGAFSGSAGPRGQSANPSAVQLSTQAGASPDGTHPLVLGTATREPTPSATPKASATPGAIPSHGGSQKGADICRQYFESFGRHAHGARTKAREELFGELSQLAKSDSPRKVFGYCEQQLYPVYAATPWPTSSGDGGFPFPGSGGAGGGPDSGAGAGQEGSGQATSGPGGSGSDHGSR
jgi:hypothetical protein